MDGPQLSRVERPPDNRAGVKRNGRAKISPKTATNPLLSVTFTDLEPKALSR